MIHTCHADGCHTFVPPKMFMCLRHWKKVPKDLQARIWAAYRPGQEVDKDPSEAYVDVAREAIEYVAKKEKRK